MLNPAAEVHLFAVVAPKSSLFPLPPNVNVKVPTPPEPHAIPLVPLLLKLMLVRLPFGNVRPLIIFSDVSPVNTFATCDPDLFNNMKSAVLPWPIRFRPPAAVRKMSPSPFAASVGAVAMPPRPSVPAACVGRVVPVIEVNPSICVLFPTSKMPAPASRSRIILVPFHRNHHRSPARLSVCRIPPLFVLQKYAEVTVPYVRALASHAAIVLPASVVTVPGR